MMSYAVALSVFLFIHLSVSLTLNIRKIRADAIKYCNHFGNGHLAYPTTEKTMQVIKDLTLDSAYPATSAYFWIRIGLTQVDRSVEPAGGWAWVHPDGRTWNISDMRLLLWAPTKPNNYVYKEHEGYYLAASVHRLDDGELNHARNFVCEYEATQKHFKSSGKDQMGHNATHISQSYEKRISGFASRCLKELLCRGYSYKQTDGHCILHFTTSDGVPALSPVAASGYKMFDTYY